LEKYQRRNNESFLDWKLRLIIDKIEKTSDLDWIEIRDLLGLECSPDHLRKTAYGIYEYKNYIDEKINENINDEKVFKQLELKKLELQKEKMKVQTTKLELNKLLRKDARYEEFWDRVQNSIETIEAPIFQEVSSIGGEKIGLVGLSDIHFGKLFDSYNNSYSTEICKQRLNILMNEIIEWIKDRNIVELHILNCGDSLDGLLRVNQIRVLEMGVIDSAIEFGRMMAEWLNQLSKYMPLTYHHVKSANHTEIRFLNVQAGSFPDEDLEKVIINYIHDVLKDNPRINVPLYESEYAVFSINGKNILAFHGHQHKGKKPEALLKELQILLNIKIDYMIIGHLHHDSISTVGESELGNIKVVILPSLMGSDAFSDKLLTGAKAGVMLFEFNTNKKGISTTEVILN